MMHSELIRVILTYNNRGIEKEREGTEQGIFIEAKTESPFFLPIIEREKERDMSKPRTAA